MLSPRNEQYILDFKNWNATFANIILHMRKFWIILIFNPMSSCSNKYKVKIVRIDNKNLKSFPFPIWKKLPKNYAVYIPLNFSDPHISFSYFSSILYLFPSFPKGVDIIQVQIHTWLTDVLVGFVVEDVLPLGEDSEVGDALVLPGQRYPPLHRLGHQGYHDSRRNILNKRFSS